MTELATDGPGSWAASSRCDRAELLACGICGASHGVDCSDGFIHCGRRFELALTWPGGHIGRDELALLEGPCLATVESTYAWDFTRPGRHDVAHREAILYRGACVGCGWAAASSHHDSNHAIEDALDHTLEGWRQVPIVERFGPDTSPSQLDAWKQRVAEIYDGFGLDRRLAPGEGGVVRTRRRPMGTRSHRSRGFYDICAEVIAERPAAAETGDQLGLF